MRSPGRILALGVVFGALPVGPRGAPLEALLEERAKARVREVRLRVRPERLAPAGACLDFGLDDLEVSLRGEPVERGALLDLERERRPALHAVLIDTSGSTSGKLDFFREAAAGYLGTLRPDRESGMVLGFDESVVLMQPPTHDPAALAGAVERLRMGMSTALVDALYVTLRELEAHRERAVILLITDGHDTASQYEREDVNALADSRPDLVVFTIGVGMPPLTAGGPPGMLSARRFLQRLAERTDGRYFELATGTSLAQTFARIRELLDGEALLTLTDPDPDAEPGRLAVTSLDPDCRVIVLRDREPEHRQPRHVSIPPPFPERRRLPLAPPHAYARYYVATGKGALHPACRPPEASLGTEDRLWFVDVAPDALRGCVLDVTMEVGLVYAAESVLRYWNNGWIEQQTRPFHVPLPRVEALPVRVEQALPHLVSLARALRVDGIATHPLQVPVERHARPFHDVPILVNGALFTEMRPTLARAAFTRAEYRAWVQRRLGEEAAQELRALAERFARLAPGWSAARLRDVARDSPQGQAILERATGPADVDLQQYLAAWLGDVPAHDLFVRWEMQRIEHLLEGQAAAGGFASLRESWEAVRRLLYVPSYARILTLLVPGFDPERRVVGYWRIVLPRSSWMLRRIQGYDTRVDYGDLPLDLVPDLPLGLWVAQRVLDEPALVSPPLDLRGFRPVGLRYELLGKPHRHDPDRAFRDTGVELRLAPPGKDGRESGLLLTARVSIERGRPVLVDLGVGPWPAAVAP